VFIEPGVVAHESGFVGAGGGQERITVAENGSPCVIAAAIKQSSMGQGEITTPPSHGTATPPTTAEATFISYIPAREYLGEDRFAVAFGPNFNVTVCIRSDCANYDRLTHSSLVYGGDFS
jgi:hypothetical protein